MNPVEQVDGAMGIRNVGMLQGTKLKLNKTMSFGLKRFWILDFLNLEFSVRKVLLDLDFWS